MKICLPNRNLGIVYNKIIDLQINGYAGVDFNNPNDLTSNNLRLVCDRLKSDNIQGILATIITGDIEEMCLCLRKIVEIRKKDPLVKQIIMGFHIEGPFLSDKPGYLGAHPAKYIVPANTKMMDALLNASAGLTKIVTLAPETDKNFEVIRMLSKEGVIVSAGHSDASLQDLEKSISVGLSMFTHFGNGCPLQMHRHDNIIQRALHFRDHLWFSFIGDGIHLPIFALNNYLELVGIERSIIVSDAMSAAGAPAGNYTLGNLKLSVSDDHIARDPINGTFAGSAMTMRTAYSVLKQKLKLGRAELKMLFDTNPIKCITET